MNAFIDIFPSLEIMLEMEPEELAPFVLRHISTLGSINSYNYTLSSNPALIEYAGNNLPQVQQNLMEAFAWLERELLVAPSPSQGGEWKILTRKGKRLLEEEDFNAYKSDYLLPSDNLHPVLIRKVKPLFLRGDYDTAIFQAFKAVEVAVRKSGGYSKGDYGVNLMRTAFNPASGKLTNTHSEQSEKQAMSDLFAGAIGLFKNPVSHRDIEGITAREAADYIGVANCLLKMVTTD